MRIAATCLPVAITLFLLGTACHSDADEQSDDDYRAYEAYGKIGQELFIQNYEKNGKYIRVAALLDFCGYKSLADAVRQKQADTNFKDALYQFMLRGRFQGLPRYSIFAAQNGANSMSVGYEFGYKDALSLLKGEELAKQFCANAAGAANEILK